MSAFCPRCGSRDSSIYDSRTIAGGAVKRKRICEPCKCRWTTFEISEDMINRMLTAVDGARRTVESLMGGIGRKE